MSKVKTVDCKCGKFVHVYENGQESVTCPRCKKTYKLPKTTSKKCVDCGKVVHWVPDFGFKMDFHCSECLDKSAMEAELAYGLKANFEAGSTVVNVMTSEKMVVPH